MLRVRVAHLRFELRIFGPVAHFGMVGAPYELPFLRGAAFFLADSDRQELDPG